MTGQPGRLHRPPTGPGAVGEHPLPGLLALHLLPGVLTAAFFYAVTPVLVRAGQPAVAGAVLAVLVVLVPVEVGWLLREAGRRTGSRALAGVLPYRPGPFTWRKALLVVALLVWGIAVSLLGIGGSTRDSFFSWMPGWAADPLSASEGSSTARIAAAVGFVLVLVVLGPLVEELYFRGYLLPRLGRFGAWAPLLNVGLFALYHFWKPWDVVNLVIVLGPMVYAVWRLEDIRIGIALHIALNSVALLNVLPALLDG